MLRKLKDRAHQLRKRLMMPLLVQPGINGDILVFILLNVL